MVVALLQFLADNFGGGMNIQKAVYGIGADSKSNQFGVGNLLWSGKIIGISLGFSLKDILNDYIFHHKFKYNKLYNEKTNFDKLNIAKPKIM